MAETDSEATGLGFGAPQMRSDLVAGLNWYAATAGLTPTRASDLIVRVAFQIDDADSNITLTAPTVPSNLLSLFVLAMAQAPAPMTVK